MTAKTYIDQNRRNRAGVPLARARRLAQKADDKTAKGGGLGVSLAVMAALMIGGSGYVYSTSNLTADAATAAPLLSDMSSGPTSDRPETDKGALVVAEPRLARSDRSPQVASPEILQAPVEAGDAPEPLLVAKATPLTPQPRRAPCVAQIEDHLRTLHTTATPQTAWETKRDQVRETAQVALNCDFARVELDGDLGLAASGFAGLLVEWNRSDAVLALRIIDTTTDDVPVERFAEDGMPVAFRVD